MIRTPSHDFRPTTGMVRQAIFDILTARIDPDGAVFTDAFAGSGAVGFEAVSRGFSRAFFIEKNGRAYGMLKKNTAALDLDKQVMILRVNGFSVSDIVRRTKPDVLFLDPPYAFCNRLDAAICALFDDSPAELPRFIITETDSPLSASSGDYFRTEKEYGNTLLTIFSRDT